MIVQIKPRVAVWQASLHEKPFCIVLEAFRCLRNLDLIKTAIPLYFE